MVTAAAQYGNKNNRNKKIIPKGFTDDLYA
jgi:hypothetical protein